MRPSRRAAWQRSPLRKVLRAVYRHVLLPISFPFAWRIRDYATAPMHQRSDELGGQLADIARRLARVEEMQHHTAGLLSELLTTVERDSRTARALQVDLRDGVERLLAEGEPAEDADTAIAAVQIDSRGTGDPT